MLDINYLAVLVAAIASFVIAAVWYGPLFGKQWMKLVGKTKEEVAKTDKNEMTAMMVISFATSVVSAFFLAIFIKYIGAETWAHGAAIGLMVWIGFVATSQLPNFLYEGRSLRLFKLIMGHNFLAFAAMGAILAVM